MGPHSLTSPGKSRLRWLPALLVLTTAVAGCSFGIGVRRNNLPPLLTGWRDSFFESDELSPRTLQTLRRLDLAELHGRHPRDAYRRLHQAAVADPQPDSLFALAELCYHIGRAAEKSEEGEAVAYYYLCAGYAYHFLFPSPAVRCRGPAADTADAPRLLPPLGPDDHGPLAVDRRQQARDAFDPRFRLACDLYNNGLAKCIRAAQRVGRLDPRHQLHLPTKEGDGFMLSIAHHGFSWRPEDFGPLQFCSDFEVYGLDNHFRTYGLGVPLICTRAEADPSAPGQAFYPREVSFPVTAFFRFEGGLADLGACRAGRLELYNPLEVQSVRVAGRAVPLETDLTTPLAYFLSKTDLQGLELTGFLRADRLRNRTGIYLFEPYQKGKIPVVMVHGLLSSPLTWTPLFNELRADPELRKHFQFWFYLYPTGNPYLVTAADLRQSLDRLRHEVDPEEHDAALEQMVFVGHSMGGLVSKMLTQDSGDDFWKLVTNKPFANLKASPETKAELQSIFFFEREPCIKRVVFLGTPHHGSKLGPSLPAKLLARFVRLPRALIDAASDVAEENPGLWSGLGNNPKAPQLPTSLDLLSPGAPALELLAYRPAPPRVHYHSVIGVAYGEGDKRTDGVVPYTSAHIDGVDSELVVPAIHTTVHHHPLAVLEVRRILLEHLRSLRETGVQPASCPGVQLRAPSGV